MKIIVSTLNAKYIHTCLALRYLKSYAAPEFNVEMKEYTINDPLMNIVMDLYGNSTMQNMPSMHSTGHNELIDMSGDMSHTHAERTPSTPSTTPTTSTTPTLPNVPSSPIVIGFSCYIWNIEQTIPVIQMLRKVIPNVKIVLGGPEVSYDTTYWMDRIPEVDFIVVGEGEDTFKHLLTEIQHDQKYHLVFGLAYRDRHKEIVINPPRPKLDLEQLPSPYRLSEDLADLSRRIVYMETSRGCPFSCQFCLSSIETGVRYFTIKNIQEDILFLIAHGAKLIKFVDRTFNIKRDYALEMFQFLIDNHQGCVFQFEITADIMRPEVIEFLNKHAPAGIFRFEIGVQSTNDLTNELVQRRQNFTKLARTVNLVKQGGKILQHLDLIAGLPGENYDSFRKTFNDVFALKPEELQLGFLKMLRGTGVRLRAQEHNYEYMDNAPYEILSNDVLSFAEVIRIKRVEDILEKYWNDHRLDATITYLTEYGFETPFDFFQQFGDYWDAQGWSRIGHQFEHLFMRLYEFLTSNQASFSVAQHLDQVEDLMIYDYLMHHKHRPRNVWWLTEFNEQSLSRRYAAWTATQATRSASQANPLQETEADTTAKQDQHRLAKAFREKALLHVLDNPEQVSAQFAHVNYSEQDLRKHAFLEPVHFDVLHYLQTGHIRKRPHVLLICYQARQGEHRKEVYSLPAPQAVGG